MDGDPSAIGRTGVLTVGTRGAAGPGEVLVKIRGGSETYLAWSDEPLPRGTTVLVVESRGARALTVVVWSGPSTPSPDPLN
jgi:membrane protein implicated in regulation of membrane protease activity